MSDGKPHDGTRSQNLPRSYNKGNNGCGILLDWRTGERGKVSSDPTSFVLSIEKYNGCGNSLAAKLSARLSRHRRQQSPHATPNDKDQGSHLPIHFNIVLIPGGIDHICTTFALSYAGSPYIRRHSSFLSRPLVNARVPGPWEVLLSGVTVILTNVHINLVKS
jgi:hypothetical protein